jgi:hypothetical protein
MDIRYFSVITTMRPIKHMFLGPQNWKLLLHSALASKSQKINLHTCGKMQGLREITGT